MSRIRNGIYIGIPLLLMAAIVIVVFIPFDGDSSQDQDVQITTVEIGKVVRAT